MRWVVLVLSLALAVQPPDFGCPGRAQASRIPPSTTTYRRRSRRRIRPSARRRWKSSSPGIPTASCAVECAASRRWPPGIAANQPAKADCHRRQAAAGRSRQRPCARQSRLCRARPRRAGRYGRDRADGRRRPSAAWPCCAQVAEAGLARRRAFARTKEQMARCSTARWASPPCRPRTTTRRGATTASRWRPSPTISRTSTSSRCRCSRARRSMRWASGIAARAIAIARAAKNDAAATDIDRYVRSRYRLYRGSEEGWNELLGARRRRRARAARRLRRSRSRAR